VLKFGCIGVIVVVVLAAIAVVLGPQRTQTGQLPTAIENTALAQVTAPAAAARTDAPVQSQQLLCMTELDPVSAEDSDAAVSLDGRLGGTQESFEARFGPPAEEDGMFITWRPEGCGDMLVSFTEGLADRISLYSVGFEANEAQWTIEEARHIAARLLPPDVEMAKPRRNISVVEQHDCSSKALKMNVPMSVYEYSDNNPVQGQCSVVYQLGDDDRVLNFVVQLQVEELE